MQSDSCRALPRAGLLLAGSIVLVVLTAAPAVAAPPFPPPYVLNHFRCYTNDIPGDDVLAFDPPRVTLEDQFDERRQIEEDVWVLVGFPSRFCNPVVKRIEEPRTGNVDETPISDPDAHLTMYRITEHTIHRPVTWSVVVTNQFGTQKILAKRPRFLAVPTEKVEDGLEFPNRLDHFKCYETYGKEIALEVKLTDQFEEADVLVLDPKLFCNPTRKTDSAGEEFGIRSPQLHLTCYDLILKPEHFGDLPAGRIQPIRNQFTGRESVDLHVVFDEDLLCVPSHKVTFSPVAGSLGPDD